MGQLIWRYHPGSRRYEIFAEGGGNAFGVELDARGRIYSGHNGGDTRGFHYVQGGYYQKGFGKHGTLSNPYAFGSFPPMQHHQVPRFTHTFVLYESDGLPAEFRGRLFGVGPLQSHVIMSAVEANGSSFKTRDLGVPVQSRDPWFRPVDIQVGPDGAIYVADFYEQRIDHASHYQGRVHKESGRVYRLRGVNQAPAEPFDLGALTTSELVELLEHPNNGQRQTALRLLADRQDRAALEPLRSRLLERRGQVALESLWALHQLGGLDDTLAGQCLEHDDPFVRLWTVRLLCDRPQVVAELAARI